MGCCTIGPRDLPCTDAIPASESTDRGQGTDTGMGQGAWTWTSPSSRRVPTMDSDSRSSSFSDVFSSDGAGARRLTNANFPRDAEERVYHLACKHGDRTSEVERIRARWVRGPGRGDERGVERGDERGSPSTLKEISPSSMAPCGLPKRCLVCGSRGSRSRLSVNGMARGRAALACCSREPDHHGRRPEARADALRPAGPWVRRAHGRVDARLHRLLGNVQQGTGRYCWPA